MRETKFRAWDKVNKRFCYFSFGQVKIVDDDGNIHNHGMMLHHMGHGFAMSKKEQNEMDRRHAKADYEPEQLYTGLTDKNGKSIYEGDILAGEDGEWTDNDETWLQYIAGIVTWWGNNARFFLSDDLEGYMGDDDKADEPMDWVKYEVIGNIYENRELLDEKSA